MTLPSATVRNSAVHVLDSTATGRSYRITVALPLGYSADKSERWPFHDAPYLWPVVYVLDGNWYFGMVTDIIRPMCWCGSTTDAIVVGIGYVDDEDPIESFWNSFARRDHDLTPVPSTEVQLAASATTQRPTPNGDGSNFIRFIQAELTPFIDATYRADPRGRTLVGHSYGGLLGLQALFDAPGLFGTYIIGSPTLAYGERALFAREEAYAQAHKRLDARVFIFAAENEEGIADTPLTDTLRMAAILQGRKYEGLTLKKQIFADQNHCEVAAPGFQAGLKFALRKAAG